MNQDEFVEALRVAILKGTAADVVGQWSKPSGRLRSDARTARANWINGLSAEDRALVEVLAADAAHAALFGMLCVLDGARAIEDGRDRGELHLFYRKQGTQSLLASSDLEMDVPPLHDLLGPGP